MVKNRISTLENVNLTTIRCDGNSTRQVDMAIQYLFNGYVVEVKDHFENGGNRNANECLFKNIFDRLENEHLYIFHQFIFDLNKLEIELF